MLILDSPSRTGLQNEEMSLHEESYLLLDLNAFVSEIYQFKIIHKVEWEIHH